MARTHCLHLVVSNVLSTIWKYGAMVLCKQKAIEGCLVRCSILSMWAAQSKSTREVITSLSVFLVCVASQPFYLIPRIAIMGMLVQMTDTPHPPWECSDRVNISYQFAETYSGITNLPGVIFAQWQLRLLPLNLRITCRTILPNKPVYVKY